MCDQGADGGVSEIAEQKLKGIIVLREVVEDWEWVVADEEGEQLMQMAEACVVAFWFSQDLEAEGHQLLLLQLNRSLLLRLILFVVELKEPLGLALDPTLQLLGDVCSLGRVLLLLLLEEQLCDGGLFIGKDLSDGMGGGLDGEVVEFLVVDVEGEGDHAAGEGPMGAAVLDELVQVVADLLGDALRLEKFLCRDVVAAQQGLKCPRFVHLNHSARTFFKSV